MAAVGGVIDLAAIASTVGAIGLALAAGLAVFGTVKLVVVPLAIAFEALERRRRRARTARSPMLDRFPLVSVVVPAYNEGVVLANCVRSVLGSDYGRLEVVIVDDGSTDDTAEVMAELARLDDRVITVHKPNGGKGSALNRGIRESRGEVLMFVDADGIFRPNTVREMLRALTDERVGAVCGDDRPVNLDRGLTQALALMSHAGCGLVRRAQSLLDVLHIVSGNIGAFPRAVIEEIGGFDEGTLGEDLELTWRVHRAGYRVRFEPRAIVHAESPSSPKALWRQRVRWARGLLQTMRLQRDMIGNPRFGAFGAYLVFNTINSVLVPVLTLVTLACLPALLVTGQWPFEADLVSVLAWLGVGTSVGVFVVAIGLNGAWNDLAFLWTLVIMPILTAMLAATMVSAIVKEATGAASNWNKLARMGVVTDRALQRAACGTEHP